MTPDELRAAAVLLDRMAEINAEQHPDETLAREQLDVGASSARHLADVLDLADDVTSYRSGHVGTHYEDCYRHHAGCLAARIQATARGETTSHEDRNER